jgi:hypothetical protein
VKPELLAARQAKERLARNLKNLSSYCSPESIPKDDVARDVWRVELLGRMFGSNKLGWWPSGKLLWEIEYDVVVLAWPQRAMFPSTIWKAFERVDRQFTKLRLKLRVGNLISRARDLLPGESELNKVVRLAIAGNAQAQCSLRDMVLDAQKLDELLRADRQMVILRCMAQPLAWWTIDIDHPMAKDLHWIVGFSPTVEEDKVRRRREKTRERVQRHRLAKKNIFKKRYTYLAITRGETFPAHR